MASDSATSVASQQSIKAYVDANSTATLGGIGDVTITSVADNEVLAYDSGGDWINQTAAEAGLATASDLTTHTGNTSNPALSDGSGITAWADVTILNSTIADNGGGSGIYVASPDTLILQNTIVSGHTSDLEAVGMVQSQGHNLISDASCASCSPALGDLLSTDPLLGPLRDNGGPTLTHALQPGSPAIDAGSATGSPTADQRGVSRPIDGDSDGVWLPDIGAVEQ